MLKYFLVVRWVVFFGKIRWVVFFGKIISCVFMLRGFLIGLLKDVLLLGYVMIF